MWDLKNKKILTNRGVTHEEDIFPFKRDHEMNVRKENNIVFSIKKEKIKDTLLFEENDHETISNDITKEEHFNQDAENYLDEPPSKFEEPESNEETYKKLHSENENEELRNSAQSKEDSIEEEIDLRIKF